MMPFDLTVILWPFFWLGIVAVFFGGEATKWVEDFLQWRNSQNATRAAAAAQSQNPQARQETRQGK